MQQAPDEAAAPETPVRSPAREEMFEIGTPAMVEDEGMGVEEDELEEGPNAASERRIKTPVSDPAVKRMTKE